MKRGGILSMHKILSFRHITLLLCSFRQAMRKRWVRLSLRPLALWRVMAILSLVALSCCFTLLLSSTPVSASDAVYQATGTFAPVFVTSTPIPTLNVAPVDYLPVGYGTVTPSTYWSMVCEPLINSAGGGGGSSSTSTPAVTPTPSYSGDRLVLNMSALYGGYGNMTGTLSCVIDGSTRYDWSFGSPVNLVGYDIECLGEPSIYQNFWSTDWALYLQFRNNDSEAFIPWYMDEDYQFTFPGASWATDYSGYTSGTVGSSLVANHGSSLHSNTIYTERTGSYYMYFHLSTQPISSYSFTPTPSGSPTPVIDYTNYCAVVEPSTADGMENFYFSLPNPTWGEAQCFGQTSFVLPFSALNVFGFEFDDLTLPALEVCFKPTLLGSFTYFGVVINLDEIVYAFAAVFLLFFWLGTK